MRFLPLLLAIPSILILLDDLRLRRRHHRRDVEDAQNTINALSGERAKCTNEFCNAFRFAACDGGRCRYHCQLSCECKGRR